MRRRNFLIGLVLSAAFLAGCGGSGGTPRTSAGLERAYTAFATLVHAGKYAAACDRYLTPPALAEMKAFGGCDRLFAYAIAEKNGIGGVNPRTVANGWSAVVDGTRATYTTSNAKGSAVYVGSDWEFGLDFGQSSSSSSTSQSSSAAVTSSASQTSSVASTASGEATTAQSCNGKYYTPSMAAAGCPTLGRGPKPTAANQWPCPAGDTEITNSAGPGCTGPVAPCANGCNYVPSNVPATPTTSTSTTANVTVPRLVGLTEPDASAQLGALGLTPQAVIVNKSKNPSYDGLVLSQKPHAHTSVRPGTVVTIEVDHYVPPTSTSTSSTSSSTASSTASTSSGATGSPGIGGPGP